MDRQVKWTQNLRKDRGDSLGSNMDLNREVILTDAVFVFHCVFVVIPGTHKTEWKYRFQLSSFHEWNQAFFETQFHKSLTMEGLDIDEESDVRLKME